MKPRQVQLEVFRYFFEKSTPLEVKWLVDIVLKSRFGIVGWLGYGSCE